jgi:hypothetical protein
MTKHRTKYYDDRTRPATVVVPPDFPIVKVPPGTARFATGNLNFSVHGRGPSGSARPRKLVRVSIVCPECHKENVRMVPQLRQVRAKCQCGTSLSFRWQGVKSK